MRDAAIQGTFDFESASGNGFENWRREQDARLDSLRREWGLPIGRRVRLRLRNIDSEFDGELQLVESPASIDRRVPLQLRVGQVDFLAPDIEQCVVISDNKFDGVVKQ